MVKEADCRTRRRMTNGLWRLIEKRLVTPNGGRPLPETSSSSQADGAECDEQRFGTFSVRR